MTVNMGKTDRIIRIIVAIVIAVLYFTDHISGTAAIVLGIIGLIFVITSIIGFCPLYVPLRHSTTKDKK